MQKSLASSASSICFCSQEFPSASPIKNLLFSSLLHLSFISLLHVLSSDLPCLGLRPLGRPSPKSGGGASPYRVKMRLVSHSFPQLPTGQCIFVSSQSRELHPAVAASVVEPFLKASAPAKQTQKSHLNKMLQGHDIALSQNDCNILVLAKKLQGCDR